MSYRQLSSWPPAWVWIGGNGDKHPKDEVGTLTRVKIDGLLTIHRCFLWMEYEDSAYLGCLLLSDAAFGEQIFKLFQENIGRSIEEIGSLHVGHLE
jgi:hypothetical protein